MTTDSQIIKSLYKRFGRRPSTLDERCLYLLADMIVEQRGLELDGENIVFTMVDKASPFRSIPLDNINGVADLGGLLAVVLHSSIIFINKETMAASVHIRPVSKFASFFRR